MLHHRLCMGDGVQELRVRCLRVFEAGHLCSIAFHLAQSHDGAGVAFSGCKQLQPVSFSGGDQSSAGQKESMSSRVSHLSGGEGSRRMRPGGSSGGCAGQPAHGVFDRIAAEIESRDYR